MTWTARNGIERAICRLKDNRRVATRYDTRAQTYLATVHVAAIIAFWLWVPTLEHCSAKGTGSPLNMRHTNEKS